MPKTPRMHIPRPPNLHVDSDTDKYSLISSEPNHNSPPGPSFPRPSTSSFKPFAKSPSTMRNKARLHLALYALPRYPETYHYALLTRPKDIAATLALSGVLTATKYHVKTTIRTNADGAVSNPYVYESYHIHDLTHEQPLLLASIVVGKISVSQDRVGEILRRVPILNDAGGGGSGSIGRGAKFNDVEWARLAFEALKQAGALTDDGLGWEKAFEGSMNYMRRKQAEGRWQSGWKGGNPEVVATFDMMTGKDVLF